MSDILGIDLGGTKTLIARYASHDMGLQEMKKFPTHADQSYTHVRDDLVSAIEEMRTPHTQAIGMGVPGLVNSETRHIYVLPNIPGAENQDMAGFVEKKIGLPVAIRNDAHCFALGEALYGAGKGESVVVGTTLGTGVGGGVVMDGQLLAGAHGCAAEFGHMLLQPGKPPYDAKDARGEVEQFFSGTALAKRCQEAQSPEDLLTGAACAFMHDAVYREIAWYVVNLTYAFDPAIIVFGGSVGRALEQHLPRIIEEQKRWMLPHSPSPRLAIGMLHDAAVLGAATLAKRLGDKHDWSRK